MTRRLLLVPIALLLLSAVPAQASDWKVVKLPDPNIQVALYGVSCPSPALCVTAGGNSTIAASSDPAGGPRAWGVFRHGGVEGFPGPPGAEHIYGGGQIRGVSCPSPGLCVAASFDGRIFTSTNPPGGAPTWNFVPLQEEKKPRFHAGGISCPTPSLCVAVAYAGKVAYSTNPTGGREAWTVIQLTPQFDLRGITCPSVGLCIAVGNEGNVVASTNPTGGPAAWSPVGAPLGPHTMNGISCPSPTLCVTGSAGGIAVADNPTGGAWRVVSAGTGLPIKSVSCPTTSACAAIDNNADVLVSTDPTRGPGAWSFKNVLPYLSGYDEGVPGPGQGNGMFGISCPTTSLCVGVGQDSQILTSTNPFVPDAAGPRKRKRAKRPRVRITRHPPKRLDHRKGGVRVRFRFRAIGKATRLVCKIDGRRWRKCRSPKRYRVGGGKHAFRVRAIAPGGAKGPRTSFHFRVGRIVEPPPWGTCRRRMVSLRSRPCVPVR